MEEQLTFALRHQQLRLFRCLFQRHQRLAFGHCRFNLTALHFAVCHNAVHIVRALVRECESDIDSSTGGCLGFPVAFAAYFNHEDVVRIFFLERHDKLSSQAAVRGLHAAIVRGYVDIVELFVDEKGRCKFDNEPHVPLAKVKDGGGNNALSIAERAGHVQVIALIKSATKGNAKSAKSIKATGKRKKPTQDFRLQAAVTDGNIDRIAELLEDDKCDPLAKGEHGNTFIHAAVKHNRPEVLSEFLPRFSNMAAVQNAKGNTPLHVAVKCGNLECTKILLTYTGCIAVKNAKSQTALHRAAASSNPLVLRALLDSIISAGQRSLLDVRDCSGASALHSCVSDEADAVCLEMLAEVLQDAESSSIDNRHLNATDEDGNTSLMLAAGNGDAKAVAVLLRRGADVTVCDNAYQTALHFSAALFHYEVLAMLLEHTVQLGNLGNLIDVVNGNGRTALMVCCERGGDADCMKALLDCGPDLSIADVDGMNLLHFAVKYTTRACGNAITRIIVDAINRTTPAPLAEFIFKVREASDRRVTALHMLVRDANIEGIRILGEAKCASAALSVGDKDGFTPLHMAAASNPAALRALLDTFYKSSCVSPGSSDAIDARAGGDRVTALMLCAKNGDAVGVRLLLQYGAKVIRANDANYNAVYAAVEGAIDARDATGHLQVLNVFREKVCYEDLSFQYWSKVIPRESADRRFGDALSAVQLAAAAGSADVLAALLDHDRMGSNGGARYCAVQDIIPLTLLQADAPSAANTGAVKDADTTCLDLIAKYCTQDQIVKMMSIEPLRMCVSSLSLVRTVVFYAIFLLHIAYMSCFSVLVTPTCFRNYSSNPNNTDTSSQTPNRTFAAFLAWPALHLLYEIVCFVTFFQSLHKRGLNPLTQLQNWITEAVAFFFDREQADSSAYLQYFVIMSHINSLLFCLLVIAWFAQYFTIRSDTFRTYTNVVAIVSLYGWLHTIEFVKCFPTINTLVVMAKLIFVKYVLRILFICVFVLIGFASAIRVYATSECEAIDNERNVSYLSYQLVRLMRDTGCWSGPTPLYDDPPNVAASLFMISLLYVVCICITTFALMNILIVMMKSASTDVDSLQETLWCIESLQFVVWMSQHNVFWTRTLYRIVLKTFVFSQLNGHFVITQQILKFSSRENADQQCRISRQEHVR